MKNIILSAAAISGLFLTGTVQAQTFTLSNPNTLVDTGNPGANEYVYHNLPGSAENPASIASYFATATPTYSFTNTNEGFYWNGGNSPTNTFLGFDAAGAALTDTALNGDTGILTTGSIDVTADEIAAESPGNYFTFSLTSTDDYAAIYLGGTGTPGTGTDILSQFVFSENTPTVTATVDFTTPGLYNFEYDYYNGYGGATMNLTATDPLGSSLTYSTAVAPEPSTWALMLGGVFALVVISRRRAVRA